jgi:CDGSH iron-sulfur domain-containing protein 3
MENNDKTSPAEFTVIKDGPLKVKGNFVLTDSEGNLLPNPGEIYLCRCGKSNNKPFCDGSHRKK